MSKFEDLCRAYATSRKNYRDYKLACSKFATHLANGMVDYFKCPKEQVRFIPLKEDIQPGITYSPMGEMYLEEDTFWHLGLGLTLYEKPNILPRETVCLQLLIKKANDYFIVKLGTRGREFKIRKDKPDEFIDFYEFVFSQIKESYEKELQRFLEQEETSRKIGFNV